MMASHRPAEPPPEPLPSPNESASTAQAAATPTTGTLPVSNFLVGFDWLLALGVLVLAFLIASFSVRNSDFWMHLATGRLMSNGQYSFGKDPFSYVGGDRTWINHSWLFDWLLYKVFTAGEGAGVVIAKAVAVALAAGLLLLARRPGQSVFPGVVCVGLALVASAPRLLLQPFVASLLCLAALMALLIRMPKPAGSWRFPIAIGVLFMLWANLDQWFFLGPLFLALYTVGHFIRPREGDDRITLLKALGIGVLACMLNPHHVRIWELPVELVDSELKKIVADDPEFGRIFRNVESVEFGSERENPANLYSLIGLLVLNLVGFVVNYRQFSIGLALIWAAGVGLALWHLRAIPLLAFVAAPIAAMDLGAAGARLALRTFPERTIRALHALRSGGRAAVGLAGLILIALSYPGWLHPLNDQRRWKWDAEPSQSMKRAAEHIQALRDSGTLPPEARLLNLGPDFASYVAWYAPSEKTYFDYRLRFHRAEAAEYIALRRYLAYDNLRDRRSDTFDFQGFLRKNGVTYAVTAHPYRKYNLLAISALLGDIRDPAHGPEWALWQVGGRSVIMGWTRQTTIPASTFNQLRFNPERTIATNTELLSTPDIHAPLVARDSWDRFVAAPPIPPADGEEALVLLAYRDTLLTLAGMRHQAIVGCVRLICVDRLMTPALNHWVFLDSRMALPPGVQAVALLAVRAARRAIAASPDHPEGYFYLAKAFPAFSTANFNQDVEELVTTANLARCKARLPEDPAENRTTVDVLETCDRLAESHFNAVPKRMDLVIDAFKLGTAYLRYNLDDLEASLDRRNPETRAQLEREIDSGRRMLAERERRIKELEKNQQTNRQNYHNSVARYTSPIERAGIARKYGLVREAIEELYKTHAALQKQSQSETEKRKLSPGDSARQLADHAALVELMLYDGRVEEASQILDSIDTSENMAIMEADPQLRVEYSIVRRTYLSALGTDSRNPIFTRFDNDPASHFRALRQGVAMITGDFKAATDVQVKEIVAVRKQVDEFRGRYFPGKSVPLSMPPSLFGQFDQLYAPLFAPINPVPAFLGSQGKLMHLVFAEQLRAIVQTRVELHARAALTFLEWGDVRSATHHFRQSMESPEIDGTLPPQRIAEEYLKFLAPGSARPGADP